MRKVFVILFVPVLLCSCSKNSYNEISEDSLKQDDIYKQLCIDIDPILPKESDHPIYLNIINSNECFSCSPVYSTIAHTFYEMGLPEANIIYVFPNMRKIEQKPFLNENFYMSFNQIRIFFDTSLQENFRKRYNLGTGSYLIVLDKNKILISKEQYRKNNYNELAKNMNIKRKCQVSSF